MSIAEKLTTVAENVPKVYEAGKKSEYDAFWDVYQNYGKRTQYNYAFGGVGWDDRTFKPKYPIKPINASYMFSQSNIKDWENVILDTSNMISCSFMFQTFDGSTIPIINISKITTSYGAQYMFGTCNSLVTIEKLIVSESTTYHNAMFTGTKNLENITFEGVIGKGGLTMSDCSKLSKTSITSIINALSKDTNGLAITLSKTAVNTAFGIKVDDVTTYPEGTEYYNLRHSKDNWTISYV